MRNKGKGDKSPMHGKSSYAPNTHHSQITNSKKVGTISIQSESRNASKGKFKEVRKNICLLNTQPISVNIDIKNKTTNLIPNSTQAKCIKALKATKPGMKPLMNVPSNKKMEIKVELEQGNHDKEKPAQQKVEENNIHAVHKQSINESIGHLQRVLKAKTSSKQIKKNETIQSRIHTTSNKSTSIASKQNERQKQNASGVIKPNASGIIKPNINNGVSSASKKFNNTGIKPNTSAIIKGGIHNVVKPNTSSIISPVANSNIRQSINTKFKSNLITNEKSNNSTTMKSIINSNNKKKIIDIECALKNELPMTAIQALKIYGKELSDFEKGELLDYDQIYYMGNGIAKYNAENGDGYDDERGDYNTYVGEHVGYRYEIIDILGKGSFGQALKCLDHKEKELVALKIIRSKKKFYHQATIEVKVLKYITEHDSEDKANMVKMLDFFMFRKHIVFYF